MAQVTRRTIRSPWSTGIPEYVWRHQANIAAHNVTGQLPTRRATQVLRNYAVGLYSSRRIAKACMERVDFMAIVALQAPDFRTISEFRRRHLAALSELFVQVLKLCERAGLVKLGHVALDGTKIKANASKHKAMSYERMCKREAELQAEVDGWLQAAEAADATEDKAFGADRRGDEMPDWVADKQARLAKIHQAKAELEAEAKAKAAAEQPARAKVDEKPPRKPPPAAAPEPKAQRNFTDPEKPHPQDQGRLHPGLQCTSRGRRSRADHCGAHARQQWQRSEPVRSAARCYQDQSGQQSARSIGRCRLLLDRQSSHAEPATDQRLHRNRRQKHASKSATAKRPAKPGSLLARMTSRLRRAGHRSRYRLRKQVVEPVFGQVKEARGFRQFLLRGIEKVKAEWAMICTVHNLRKLALATA
jgi:Transposase DDE domain/Transposase domain (DUF772)